MMTPWQQRTNGPGIHSIPAIHTTHKHVVSLCWPQDKTLRDAWLYAIGQTKPNYPVPAIRQWFEFVYRRGKYMPGLDLFDESVELIHFQQDRF